ncbi:MAG: hypothetical protein ACREKJ_08650 [Candidatus Rokuibacteriota bacterium]
MALARHPVAARVARLVLAGVCLLWMSAALSAQPDDRLFRNHFDPTIIAMQIRMALPVFERGLGLLSTSTDPEPTAAAVTLLNDAYRYLRAAQQSSEAMQRRVTVPDPLIDLRNKQIMRVRDGLATCVNNRFYLADPGQIRENCLDGLSRGIRTLRVIVVTLP